MTHLEEAWQEFVLRAKGNTADGWIADVFTTTREAFEAGYAAGAGYAADALNKLATRGTGEAGGSAKI